jgi:large subunit ribosomal protein L9
MEVILLEKIRNLGNIGDRVKVKAGFGRNFLLPQGKAAAATSANLVKFEKMRAELEKKAAELLAAAKERAVALAKLIINISMRASEEGKLFGSVGAREIAAAIKAKGEEIDKSEIILPEDSIHELGEFEVNLQLHSDVSVPLKINVIAEQ